MSYKKIYTMMANKKNVSFHLGGLNMLYRDLDTPALLIDRERLEKNLVYMQSYADKNKVNLRPHTKTHKMPEIAKMQL